MEVESNVVSRTTHFAMGTVMAHKIFGDDTGDCLSVVQAEINRIEGLLSRFHPGSDISRINISAGIKKEDISADTFEVLSKAIDFSRISQECFDVTIAPLVDVWHAAREANEPPGLLNIGQVLPLVNYRDLVLDAWAMTAGLNNLGQSIDLGGIGKGFTGDKIIDIYKDFGIISAYSNLGGNVVTLGARPDGSPWRVGIQHPRREDQLLGTVFAVNQTVVTSGDYQRYYVDRQGNNWHHILNPVTGYPVDSGLISVSIIAEKSLNADALSTILFVAGMEKGLQILKRFRGCGAIFVDSNLGVYITQDMDCQFQAENGIKVTILD